MRGIKLLACLGLATLIGCSLLNEGSEFRQHREFVRDNLEDNAALRRGLLASDSVPLHYRVFGEPREAVIVWVHGTPGSWTDVGKLLFDESAAGRFQWVLIDRPGWGESLPDPAVEVQGSRYGGYPAFDQQSRYISPLIQQLRDAHPQTPLLLVGHSWGASLLPTLLFDNAERVDGALLLAGGLSPDLTQPRWYNRWSRHWPVRALIGEQLRGSNVEMLALSGNLADIEQRWSQIASIPLVVIQGGRDPLVSPGNARFASDRLIAAAGGPNQRVLYMESAGHLLHMQQQALVLRCIDAVLSGQLDHCREP